MKKSLSADAILRRVEDALEYAGVKRVRVLGRAESSGDAVAGNLPLEEENEALLRRLESLEEALRHAQKLEALGALASGVAHDFNNTLQAVLGCVNLARQEGTPPERARQYLDRAAIAIERGGDLANRLTTFSRKQGSALNPVVVDPLIVDCAKLIERLLTERITLALDLDAGGTSVLAYPVQIQQILMNLAVNARDAMPEGGTLTIRTDKVMGSDLAPGLDGLKPGERYVRLVIEDTGTGMDDGTRERMFEPFFTTKEVGKGTGLGLASVAATTKQLGGHIHVESAPGRGTIVTLHLPSS
jgi:signal transduction histidine kinase